MFELDKFHWALRQLSPNAQYYINANGLDSLRWLCDLPQPANEIILTKMAEYIEPELTVADKLASVGLNLDDLKKALGL